MIQWWRQCVLRCWAMLTVQVHGCIVQCLCSTLVFCFASSGADIEDKWNSKFCYSTLQLRDTVLMTNAYSQYLKVSCKFFLALMGSHPISSSMAKTKECQIGLPVCDHPFEIMAPNSKIRYPPWQYLPPFIYLFAYFRQCDQGDKRSDPRDGKAPECGQRSQTNFKLTKDRHESPLSMPLNILSKLFLVVIFAVFDVWVTACRRSQLFILFSWTQA